MGSNAAYRPARSGTSVFVSPGLFRHYGLAAFVLSLAFVAIAGVSTARAEGFDHTVWDRVLGRFVTEAGRVDYGAIKKDSAELDRYVARLAERSPLSHPQDFPSRNSQLAYWINAYNALVIKGVVENWPVKSVTSIGVLPHSFFWQKKFLVGGKKLTLNDIEKDILLKQLSEPRVHFALVCASNSCPPLRRAAYTPENVERLLEEGACAFINDPRNVRIDQQGNRIMLSRILDWYRKDFETYVRARNSQSSGDPVLEFLKLYTNETTRRGLDSLKDPRMDYFHYDWGINDINLPATGRNPNRDKAQD